VDDAVDPLQRTRHRIAVANVRFDEFHGIVQQRRTLDMAVDLRDQAVEHADPVAATKQFLADEAADEAGAAGDQDSLAHAGRSMMLIEVKDRMKVLVSVRNIRCPTLSFGQSLRGWNEGSSSLFLVP